MRQIKIDGITYNVTETETIETLRTKGLDNLARLWEKLADGRQELALQRPKGRVIYVTMEWPSEHGSVFSKPISMGR